LLTPQHAARLLGVSKVTRQRGGQPADVHSCIYLAPRPSRDAVEFGIKTFPISRDSFDQDRAVFNSQRPPEARCAALADVGDAAIYCDGNKNLFGFLEVLSGPTELTFAVNLTDRRGNELPTSKAKTLELAQEIMSA
jgi:hypothetical protein